MVFSVKQPKCAQEPLFIHGMISFDDTTVVVSCSLSIVTVHSTDQFRLKVPGRPKNASSNIYSLVETHVPDQGSTWCSVIFSQTFTIAVIMR